MADNTGLQFTLTLPGADDTAVVRFTHREACRSRLRSRLSLPAAPTTCRPATVWIKTPPDHLAGRRATRRVHGMISELHRGDRGHRRSFYRVEIRPHCGGYRCAIIRVSFRTPRRLMPTTLANERSLTDIGFATTRTPLDREFLVQYRETDLAFIERLAAEEGCFYFHEFENRGRQTPVGICRCHRGAAQRGRAHLPRSRRGHTAPTPPA
ncbi:contractile injection system protein, VgrG/Pvc8 family [Halomonas sp. PA16-9]|uniref:contractile injection system protein, VgrG/Pvc8 family n=1 Tax=Halomonas sp. PA16-9 TaxID=2576841 RepID=UPI0030EBC441